MITNEQLRQTFLSEQMKHYLEKKLSPLSSEEVEVRIEEALKYLNMASHRSGNIPFTKEIDEVWHFWILETVEYGELCKKLHGGKFLHHSSNVYSDYKKAGNRKTDVEFVISILSSYVINYGAFDESRVKYWPFATKLMERLNWNVDQLNEWLGSVSQIHISNEVVSGV